MARVTFHDFIPAEPAKSVRLGHITVGLGETTIGIIPGKSEGDKQMITRILMNPQEVANKLEAVNRDDRMRVAAADFKSSLKKWQLAGLLSYSRQQLINGSRKKLDLQTHLQGADNRIRALQFSAEKLRNEANQNRITLGQARQELSQMKHALAESERYRLRQCQLLAQVGHEVAGSDFISVPEHLLFEQQAQEMNQEIESLKAQLHIANLKEQQVSGELEFWKQGIDRFNRGSNSILSPRVILALAEDEREQQWAADREADRLAAEKRDKEATEKLDEKLAEKLLQNQDKPPTQGPASAKVTPVPLREDQQNMVSIVGHPHSCECQGCLNYEQRRAALREERERRLKSAEELKAEIEQKNNPAEAGSDDLPNYDRDGYPSEN